jgi:ATP-dependent DNA ligase
VLVVFDVLQLAGSEVTDLALDERRAHLERLISGERSFLQLMLQTSDIEVAREWLKLLTTIEGVVAKRGDGRYATGRRPEWVKVKRYRTVDCVVIGVTGESHAPRLVLGLRHADNAVHHLGVTGAIPQSATPPILALIDRAGPLEAAIPSRWQHDAVPPWRRVPVELVCEVRAGNVDLGRWLRQPATFLRWRPDRSPIDCGLEQLS